MNLYAHAYVLGAAHLMQAPLDYEWQDVVEAGAYIATLAILRPAEGEFWQVRYEDEGGYFACCVGMN